MAPLEERRGETARGALAAATLRLVAVWLGLGLLQLAGAAARWLVVTATDAGDGSGPLSPLLRAYRTEGGGEAWTLYFLIVTAALFVVEVIALAWALRVDAKASPVALLLIGLAGLVGRALAYGLGLSLSVTLADRGVEAVASYTVATHLDSMVETALGWIVAAAVLVVLFVRALRRADPGERESPARSTGAPTPARRHGERL